MFHINKRVFLFALVLVIFGFQTSEAQTELALPQQPEAWLNSPPLTSEALRGKGAFLWFFEEGCPRCRAKWPELYAMAKKYEGQPIVFIAVNSGNSRQTVQQYAREVRLGWPVIVDPSRQFEQIAGVGEISLQNIMQVRTINGDGRLQSGSFSDPEKAVQAALKNSAWKVPLGEIPTSLKRAWQAIELGNYSSAALMVKKALNSPKSDIQEAAKKLHDAVLATVDPQLKAAREAFEAEENWGAYRNYLEVATTLKGFELPRDVETGMKSLASDEEVKHQLAALKALKLIEKSLPNQRARRGNVKRLEKLIEDYPDTDAAEQAKTWVEQLN